MLAHSIRPHRAAHTSQAQFADLGAFTEAVFDYDLTPESKTLSGAIKVKVNPKVFKKIVDDKIEGKNLLTSQQREFLKSALQQNPEKQKLAVNLVGPIHARKWDGPTARWKLEEWTMPDGTRVAEVSRKVLVAHENSALADLTQSLKKAGIVALESNFKTKKALDSLMREGCVIRKLKLSLQTK